MSLISTNPSSAIYNQYYSLIQVGESGRSAYASTWQSAYHNYATAGIGDISQGEGDSSILYSRIYGITGYQYSNVDYLAQMFADYWNTVHLEPKSPAVSIIGNDALTRVSQFRDAIISSLTDNQSTPYYNQLISNVENVVKTIVWTGLDNSGNTITGNIS